MAEEKERFRAGDQVDGSPVSPDGSPMRPIIDTEADLVIGFILSPLAEDIAKSLSSGFAMGEAWERLFGRG